MKKACHMLMSQPMEYFSISKYLCTITDGCIHQNQPKHTNIGFVPSAISLEK